MTLEGFKVESLDGKRKGAFTARSMEDAEQYAIQISQEMPDIKWGIRHYRGDELMSEVFYSVWQNGVKITDIKPE